ncbi:hypothetical protein ACQEU5_18500 [Marinactinospora thermotolerans]|uniref:Uncharacterized protein n=1 Tax=Marinactinospora thermotolerans DSM 45154 TaxID=1122192 RepID=A0A1T4T6G3_9ACTN|nr:hypothetical protein [Marinactinospora thermotolerans]SKA35909.1 hypothetical protein SAMN02745673_04553 [Marinactinospora thermotolerans DSM 45154]
MRRVAITGHRELPVDLQRVVDRELRRHLGGDGSPLVGLTCLADGADTIFARAVLDAGGTLEAVVPAEGYRRSLPAWHRAVYDALLPRARQVHRLPFAESTPEAHLAAGRLLVDECDELVAVWDGEPARGPGGTADVVAYARERERPVLVIWPEGERR